LAGFFEDIVVIFVDRVGELVAAQILPDVFDRVELGCVGRLVNKCDVAGYGEAGGEMISSAVENKGCVRARCDVVPDFFEMHGHDFGVGGRRDEGCGGAALRANGAKNVGPFVTLIARRTGARPAFGPDTGQRALLANARLVLEPDFERLSFGMIGEFCCERCGEVFLKASCAASSACGCCGRTDRRR